jgi:transcriptional regulator with XRE-family HTH domain
MNLGLNIKFARIKQKIRQGELADKIGITKCSLSRIEACKQSPSMATLEKIAAGLNTTVSELTKESEA